VREVISLNNDWQYVSQYREGMELLTEFSECDVVNIPHANIEIPYNYFDEKIFQFVSCYKLPIFIEEAYRSKIAVIRFEGVMTYAKVFLNGEYVGDHKGGYTPFEFDITGNVKYNETNVLTVVVDSTEREDIPPFGGQIDYLTYGGIYREVSLTYYDKLYIENIKVETSNIYEEKKRIDAKIFVKNTVEKIAGELKFELCDEKEQSINTYIKKVDIEKGSFEYSLTVLDIENIKLWDIDNPSLYIIKITLEASLYTDLYETRIGFRECEFRTDGFFLNGECVKLVGLNRHQSYPYNGYAMPKRVQEKDADILKNDLHINMVRTSHYPQSIHFLNRCDELGLLVFEEIPGWQHIGNEEWKQVAIENVREMIVRDWNHPSIVIWGVRINESQDDDVFYSETNKVAHELDSTRQTGGVRFITNSNLLEDVYTINDFILDGGEVALREQQEVTGLKSDVPYLVTEYNGHMYPTKKFDQEERQMEHVIRHLRVQDKSMATKNISGAIGWCAFDYNTHRDFGAGDKICYHGVMDIYRNKKFAAYVYKSQVSPSVEAVVKPVTLWARGERSIGGILPLTVLTNCDYIELKYGDFEPKKFYPSRDKYLGLLYPPVVINIEDVDPSQMGEWGMKWEDCEIKGYVNGEVKNTVKLSNNPMPSELVIDVDDVELSSKEKDATRVIIKVVDQFGNEMPYVEEIIDLELEGVGRIIGPSRFVLTGGSRGFYVETFNKKGDILIKIKSTLFGDKEVKVTVK
jgi:beta-galactosidase